MINKVLDLTKEDDLKTFHDAIKNLKDIEWFGNVLELFGVDESILDRLDKFADKAYEEAHKDDEPIVPERPSEKLTTEQGLQIHKLVQEYVDTMIKPYNDGKLTDQQINDAYAGLYEFAAWILNKE